MLVTIRTKKGYSTRVLIRGISSASFSGLGALSFPTLEYSLPHIPEDRKIGFVCINGYAVNPISTCKFFRLISSEHIPFTELDQRELVERIKF